MLFRSIAGKTGTAQIAQNNAGYNKSNYKASFSGYFPAEDPKYSMIVVINNPSKGVYYGGSIAGPVFKEVADKVYSTRLDFEAKKSDSTLSATPIYASGNASELHTIFKSLNVLAASDIIQNEWSCIPR